MSQTETGGPAARMMSFIQQTHTHTVEDHRQAAHRGIATACRVSSFKIRVKPTTKVRFLKRLPVFSHGCPETSLPGALTS